MLTKVDHTRFPRVPIWRRGIALGIDFFVVWLFSSLLGGSLPNFQVAQVVIFLLAWLSLRVFLTYGNQGQSLGRWALDMKVLDAEYARLPGLQALFKREGITGLGASSIAIALNNITLGATLLLLPLAIDCGLALCDPELRQAFHDRIARTMVISTRRGFSLDIKVRRFLAQAQQSMRK